MGRRHRLDRQANCLLPVYLDALWDESGASGSDGSPEGKQRAVHNIRTRFKQPGVYGEVSHKVKDIALAAGAPVVCVDYVSDILGKNITPVGDNQYERSLSGVGRVVKVMVGKPRGVPQDCPVDKTAGLDDICDLDAHCASLAMR
jgi:hypothetical protein